MALTRLQRRVLEYKARNPNLKDVQIAEDMGICAQSLSNWWKKEEFNEAYDKELKVVWKEYADECQKLMMGLANNGDYRAIAYILDSNNYKAPTEIELTTNDIRITIDD